MKKFLLLLGLISASILISSPKESDYVGAELQKLIECSARDAALQAEMEVSAALVDAVTGLSERVRDMERNVQSMMVYSNLPSKAAATKSDITGAQMRISELEKCVDVLATSVDRKFVTTEDVERIDAQVNNIMAKITVADPIELQSRMSEIETRVACSDQNMQELQSNVRIAQTDVVNMKRSIRSRM